LPGLSIVQALVGQIEPRLAGDCDKEQARKEPDQQKWRQGNVPPAKSAQFLTKNFHVIARATGLKSTM
jgi:hypothetical protein